MNKRLAYTLVSAALIVLGCSLGLMAGEATAVCHGKKCQTTTVLTTTVEPPPPPAVQHEVVVLINFTNDQSQPWTPQQARTIAFDGPTSVAAFYLEASYGKQTIAGDVLGWWTVPYTNEVCDTLAWKNAARQIALSQGINLDTDYDQVALVWPRTTSCGFNSRTGSFHNGDFKPYSLAHEIGHGLGMDHAKGYFCVNLAGDLVPLSTTCTTSEYGDIFDVMGASLRHFNGWEKARLGWLTNYQTVTMSGDYTIAPLEWQPQTSPQLLLIQRANGTVFTLEFRQHYGFDPWNTTDFAVTGVHVRIASEMPAVHSQNANTWLLDAHPGGVNSWFDAPIAPGETLTDPLGGITITAVSVAPSGAVVHVGIG